MLKQHYLTPKKEVQIQRAAGMFFLAYCVPRGSATYALKASIPVALYLFYSGSTITGTSYINMV